MYNRVILMGRLTRDPELKTTQSGISMCRFSIAVDRYSKGDEKKADFIDCTAWRQTAEFVCKYFSKGRMIHIEGDIQNNNYTDNNGVKHYSNIVNVQNVSFCGDKSGGQEGTPEYRPSQAAMPQSTTVQPTTQPNNSVQLGSLEDFVEIGDGEVPF